MLSGARCFLHSQLSSPALLWLSTAQEHQHSKQPCLRRPDKARMLSEIICLLWPKGTFLPARTDRGCYATQILVLIKINLQNPQAQFGRNDPLITQQSQCQQLPQSARYLQGLEATPVLRWPMQEHISNGQHHFSASSEPHAGLLGIQGWGTHTQSGQGHSNGALAQPSALGSE